MAEQSHNSSSAEALYVHVPICRAKCRYCDFYSQASQPGLAELTVKALVSELASRKDLLHLPLRSIFIGGGTPTALPPELLAELLETLNPLADSQTEFTVEANPGTLDSKNSAVLARTGVNRVSLGGQSFDPGELELLGRIHQPQHIDQAVQSLRHAGIENINLDLIYGIPGQSVNNWLANLQAAVELGVEHLSCYALSFEEGTELFEDLATGRVTEVDDETQRQMYYATIDYLESQGFGHYEISNFAKPGRACKHNLTYWRNEEYLGIGPAACSYILGQRRTNAPDLSLYAEKITPGQAAPHETEYITGPLLMAETLMLGLRLINGVDVSKFQDRFGITPTEAFPETFARYIELGAIQQTPTHIHLSRDSLFTANSVLADILAESEK